MNSTTPAIEVRNLTVSFYGETILSDLSLQIPAGKIAAVIGPNGSGKTTLLRALLGLVRAEQGEILFFGEETGKKKIQMAYVPQYFGFDRTFPITVREFLELVPKRGGHTIEEVLREVNMVESKNRLLGTLSGGELQRILIARAVLKEADIMFLDEPILGVDIAGIKKFYELIGFLNKKHKTTIVLVLHEIDAVYNYAEHVVCLNRSVVCAGRPHEVLTTETLKQLYGKETELTRLPEKIHG